MKRDREWIRDMIRGCLTGGMIGDGLGLPFEMMRPEDIWMGVPGGEVTGFIADPTGCSEEIRRRLKKRPVGMISDDTQLTLASADSLVRLGGFDLANQAIALVEAYHFNTDNVYGWGGTTLDAAAELSEWFASGGVRGRGPMTPVPIPTMSGKGCGNGVAMRIGPLAIYHALTYDRNAADFFPDMRALGLMTHGDARAWIAAACVGLVVSTPLLEGRLSAIDFVDLSGNGECGGCDTMEVGGIEKLTTCIICNSRQMEEEEADRIPDIRSLSVTLGNAFRNLDDPQLLREFIGTSSFALESVPFAIATFLRHPTDFRAAVLEAVNAGGDTDTTASMVGAMVGANVGASGIPAEWIEMVPATSRASELADEMIKKFYRP